jgi:hypothetical protein
MCCFSGPVEHVSGTRIFARAAGDGRQILVYSMTAAARRDVAMVLPLPVPPGPADDAVRFIDLHGYQDFFEDLDRGFPPPIEPQAKGLLDAKPMASRAMLEVHQVGDFEASFVPARADFKRLDPHFRLPDGIWDRLPIYRDYGFAVFKLRYGEPAQEQAQRGWFARLFGLKARPPSPPSPVSSKTIHPMAFEFPLRSPGALFFPTVHIHDGSVSEEASFDHMLYAQPDQATEGALKGWEASSGAASTFMDVRRSAGVIDGAAPCRRTSISGPGENRDIFVGAAATGVPRAG